MLTIKKSFITYNLFPRSVLQLELLLFYFHIENSQFSQYTEAV